MGNRLIILESERNRIRKMYGLVKEQTYMDKYPGTLLDFCGYRAIETFEETMGDPNGQTMGKNYFESKISDFDSKISNNIQNSIGLENFNKFPPKLKMQIWSFMFNGTDASQGTFKWLAGLSQAMNMDKFKDDKTAQDYRINVAKKGTKEYNDTISQISNFNGSWDSVFSNYLTVLDKQYMSTAVNNNKQGSYENSWKYRPGNLNKYYDECKSGKVQTSNNQASTQNVGNKKPITIQGNGFQDLRNKLKEKTANISIDPKSIKIDMNKFNVSYLLGDKKIQNISLIFDDQGQLENRLPKIKDDNKTMVEIGKGKVGNIEWLISTI